jgi:pyruvate dehydrogenase E1 component beta subunit
MSGGKFLSNCFSWWQRKCRPIGAQHSTAFESYYANIPGLKVVSPSNPYDAKGLLKQSIRYEEDPVMFMESEVMYGDKGEVPEEEYYIPLGKSDVKKQGPRRNDRFL